MAAVAIPQPPPRQTPTPPPQAPPLSLDTSKREIAPIPNKHIPYCSPGPVPCSQRVPATPPASPPTKHSDLQAYSILYPPETYGRAVDRPSIFSIDPSILATALSHLASQEFPDPKYAFPWLHGLHPENQVQLAFFLARRKGFRDTPRCFRGLTIIKAGGDLSKSKINCALAPEEVLQGDHDQDCSFLDLDPKEGFSVRNFHIQAAKMATVSDIVIYRDEDTTQNDMLKLAKKFAIAQSTWRVKNTVPEQELSPFNTFVVSSSFKDFEASHPELVAISSQGETKDGIVDFFQLERTEMCRMSHATEIAKNVWLGPTPDSSLCPSSGDQNNEPLFDILIEASDLAQAPETRTLARIGELSLSAPQHLDFPSSGSIMPFKATSLGTLDPVTEMCQWIHRLTNPGLLADTSEDEPDSDGDIPMKSMSARSRKILIHCTDGYTETSLLGLAYFMYTERIPVHEAWLRLHCEKKRNFFAYPSDVALLSSLQSRILEFSCAESNGILGAVQAEPAWLLRMDGSLPSRILPYMYLGNIGHANNLDLLQAMGIKRILSIGEPVNWTTKSQKEKWGARNILSIDRVQDNGIDPLMNLFDRCLEFIAQGKEEGSATLVHCRVGVSRSATICIAEVMSSLQMSFPRAYCFVRARRLNVIIQPHLRFAYELLKWEEVLQKRRGEPVRREMEWAAIAREIAAMNKPYTR